MSIVSLKRNRNVFHNGRVLCPSQKALFWPMLEEYSIELLNAKRIVVLGSTLHRCEQRPSQRS